VTTTLVRAFANQRRTVLLALALCVAAIWISVPMGEWQIGVFISVGMLLSLVNHVMTEQTLLSSVEDGDLPTRKQFALSSLVRLMAISLVAFVLALAFWPDGATVFLGLALFHLVTLVFTGIPLLKEIKKA
jgi:ATP synthase I chain